MQNTQARPTLRISSLPSQLPKRKARSRYKTRFGFGRPIDLKKGLWHFGEVVFSRRFKPWTSKV